MNGVTINKVKPERLLDSFDNRSFLYFQNQGPGTICIKKGAPPQTMNDGWRVNKDGAYRESGAKVFRGQWYARTDTDNTIVEVEEL